MASAVPSEPFLRRLYEPLREQALARVDIALKVAVMSRAGISRADMADRLQLPPREIRAAVTDLQEIAARIELGDRPGTGD